MWLLFILRMPMNTIYGEPVNSFNKNPRHEDFFMTFEREKMQPIKNPFRLFRQYLSFSYGGICYAGKNKQAHLQHKILTASAGTSGWHDGEGMHCALPTYWINIKSLQMILSAVKCGQKIGRILIIWLPWTMKIYGIWKSYLDIIRKNCFKSPHFVLI